MHVLSSLQAVAHGSETVQYFQWRKSRGGYEKFHGAVVDHCGHENTRVFKEVSQVGEMLSKLTPILGTSVSPEVAVIYDWENSWAISGAIGPRRDKKDYFDTCQSHYRTFWEKRNSYGCNRHGLRFFKLQSVGSPHAIHGKAWGGWQD